MRTFLIICLALFAISVQAQDQVEVQLVPGYNFISCNVLPPENMFDEDEERGPHVPLMFEEIIGDRDFNIFDDNGGFYLGVWGVCQIPYWDLTRGLVVEVRREDNIIWEGERIPADTEIQLNRQIHNVVAYFPTFELNASADEFYVLSPIIDQVRWAIDDQGHFMLPEFNFSNMNPWRQGEGYMIVVEENVILSYPEERDEEPVMFEDGDHWELPEMTRYLMPVLLTSIIGPEDFEPAEGDQVGAFDEDDEIVGCGTVHDGVCGIGIMGGEQNGGLENGEEFTLFYWDEDREEEHAVNVEEVIVWEDGLVYHHWRPIVIEVSIDPGVQIIRMNQGWNIVSLNVEPPEEMWAREEGPDIELMMEELVDDDVLIMMKDEVGRFYSTEFEFNNIPYWNLTEGYQVNVTEDTECSWMGNPIPPDREIPIEEGWNIIAYFPDYTLSAEADEFYVLSPIIENVVIAKNGAGEFLSPEFGFSNMPPWEAGQGYQVNVDADVVLQYPEEREEEVANCEPIGDHWLGIPTTDNNMSVLVTSISGIEPSSGSQIAAYTTDGQIVGVGNFRDGKCGIAVWGAETGKHGLQPEQPFELRLWDAGKDCESDLSVTTLRMGGGLVYEVDGLTVMDVSVTSTPPDNYFLSEAFPNPFNNRTTVKYGLPEAGTVYLTIYDLSGRIVMEFVSGEQSAGIHELDINCTDLTSGIYMLSMNSNRMNFTQKLVLVK